MFRTLYNFIKKIREPDILLGRWNSINKEQVKNKNIVWANYDNCFCSMISSKKPLK